MNSNQLSTGFSIGESVWINPARFPQSDPRTFIILDLMRGFLGSMMAEIIPETNPFAASEFILLKHLTNQMPSFMTPHPEHCGSIHHTATGRIVKCIEGGRANGP